MRVALFDTRVGNLHSLAKALEAGGAGVRIEPDPAGLLDADALVIPGVGAFGAAAGRLEPAVPALRAAILGGFPALGVCLGMQLLFEASEEGGGAGLAVVPGRVRRLRAGRVPHMGWNVVNVVGVGTAAVGTGGARPRRAPHPDPIFAGTTHLIAYYANSFVCDPADPAVVIAWTEYEGVAFPAAVRRANAWGVQFHPEKSGEAGLRLICNFLEVVDR